MYRMVVLFPLRRQLCLEIQNGRIFDTNVWFQEPTLLSVVLSIQSIQSILRLYLLTPIIFLVQFPLSSSQSLESFYSDIHPHIFYHVLYYPHMLTGTVAVGFYIQTLRPDIYITTLRVVEYSLSSHQIKKNQFIEEKIPLFYRFSNTCFSPKEMHGSKRRYKIITAKQVRLIHTHTKLQRRLIMFNSATWFNKMCILEKQGRNILKTNCKELVLRQIKTIGFYFSFSDSDAFFVTPKRAKCSALLMLLTLLT